MRDDSALIKACLDGDPHAWGEMVERYQRLIYSIPRRLGLSGADADDVFQTVFGIVLRRLETLRAEERVAAWLIRVTYRESWRWLRRRSRAEALPEHTPDAAEPGPDDLLRWERQHIVRQGLGMIEHRCRQLLEALFLEHPTPSYDEIAARLGLRVGSIGPTRARCFEKLEAILNRLGIESRL